MPRHHEICLTLVGKTFNKLWNKKQQQKTLIEVILKSQKVKRDTVLLLASTLHKHAKIHITSKVELYFRSRANFRAILNFHLEV